MKIYNKIKKYLIWVPGLIFIIGIIEIVNGNEYVDDIFFNGNQSFYIINAFWHAISLTIILYIKLLKL